MIRNENMAFKKFLGLNPVKQKKIVLKLVNKLKNKNEDVKCNILYALGKLGSDASDAVPAIIESFYDKEFNSKTNAAYALIKVGTPAVPFLIESLKNEDPVVRASAAWALGKIGHSAKEAVPALVEILKDNDKEVRYYAAESLGEMRSPVVVPDLVKTVADSDYQVSESAVHALRNIGTAAVPDLIQLLKTDDPLRKANIARTLGQIKPPAKEAIPALLEALNDRNSDVKMAVLFALGEIGSDREDIITAILGVFKEGDSLVKSHAAYVLSKIGTPAIPALIELLKDKDPKVKGESAWALGEIGPSAKDAVPALIETFKHADNIVKIRVATSLGRIGADAKDAIPILIKAMLEEKEFWDRKEIALALSQMGVDVIPAIFSALKDKVIPGNEPVGSDVIEILTKIGHPAVPYLIEGLKNQNDRIRVVAALSLGRIKPVVKESIPVLIGTLNDKSNYVKISAINALGAMGPDAKEVVPTLIETLNDKDSSVRISAINALGEMGPDDKEAVPVLIKFLENKNENIRESTAEALGKIGPDAGESVPKLKKKLKDIPWVRVNSALALWQIAKSKKGIDVLVSSLKSNDQWIIELSMKKLSEIGPPAKRAIPYLRKFLKEEDSFRTRKNALHALCKIGNKTKDAVPDFIAVLNDIRDTEHKKIKWDTGDQEIAAKALGEIGSDAKQAIPVLIEFLKSKHGNYRELSARTLAKIGTHGIHPLIETLKSESISTGAKGQVVKTLGEIGPDAKKSIPALIGILNDKNYNIRWYVGKALKSIDPD